MKKSKSKFDTLLKPRNRQTLKRVGLGALALGSLPLIRTLTEPPPGQSPQVYSSFADNIAANISTSIKQAVEIVLGDTDSASAITACTGGYVGQGCLTPTPVPTRTPTPRPATPTPTPKPATPTPKPTTTPTPKPGQTPAPTTSPTATPNPGNTSPTPTPLPGSPTESPSPTLTPGSEDNQPTPSTEPDTQETPTPEPQPTPEPIVLDREKTALVQHASTGIAGGITLMSIILTVVSSLKLTNRQTTKPVKASAQKLFYYSLGGVTFGLASLWFINFIFGS